MMQKIITLDDNCTEVDEWVNGNGVRKIFLVAGKSVVKHKLIWNYLNSIKSKGISVIHFKAFQPNPLYENVLDGVHYFRQEKCDGIVAIGGGSAMDVAKCVKAYCCMNGNGESGEFLSQEIKPNKIPFLVMPTTAGTGSEATRYAVIYYGGKKQSVTSDSIIPETVLMNPEALTTLPLYYKKAAMLDALCHAVEAFWSVNSTEESKEYSKRAIRLIIENMGGYLRNSLSGRKNMLIAANEAGKAINITQTTAGHAMCYKITSLFGVAHGHAAILCNRVLLPWMVDNIDKCIDPRGEEYLVKTLDELGRILGSSDRNGGAEILQSIFDKMELEIPLATEAQYDELKTSVNPVRLKNYPVELDERTIDRLYHNILR